MKNKKNTVLFISLLVLVTLVLGSFFRKIDFNYLKDKYQDETNEIESSSNLNSEVANQDSYNVTFTANDFRNIYFQGDSVTREGITIGGDNFTNPNSLGFELNANEVATTLEVTHDKSWKAIDSFTFDVLLPINNIAPLDGLVDVASQGVYLSWQVALDVTNEESSVSTSLESAHVNVFDKGSYEVTYSAALSEVVSVLVPSQEETTKTSNIKSDFNLTTKTSYSIHGLEVAPTLSFESLGIDQVPMFVYYANISGTHDSLNNSGALFERQIYSFANEFVNSKGVINTSSDVETIEVLASKALNLDVDIYNAYDMPFSDDQILYQEIASGLDNERVDIKVLLSNDSKSYYVPVALDMSAFFEGSPREIECCTPYYEEKIEAQKMGSQMLTTWLNNPTYGEMKTFAYVLYYSMDTKLFQPLFDEGVDEDQDTCSYHRCSPWVRFEPLPLVDLSAGEQKLPWYGPEKYPSTRHSWCVVNSDAMKPGGKPWVDSIPLNYPMLPYKTVPVGQTVGEYKIANPSTTDVIDGHGPTRSLESINMVEESGPSPRFTRSCTPGTFIPIPKRDSIAYPNAEEVNGSSDWICFDFVTCEKLLFSMTEPEEFGYFTIQYPDVGQVSRTFEITFSYTYTKTDVLATYANIAEATNQINSEITRLAELGTTTAEGFALRSGSTYADIEKIIWDNITYFGWNALGASRATPENVRIEFYNDALGTNKIPNTEPLKYGEGTSNKIYYSFVSKDNSIIQVPGTIETLAPFSIYDTTHKDYTPSSSEIAAGSSCMQSLINSKSNAWNATTTYGDIKTAINNDQTFNCLEKFGLLDIKSSIELSLYKDQNGIIAYGDEEPIGVVDSQNTRDIYYQYKLVQPLNYWEAFTMPVLSFELKPSNGQSIYIPGHEGEVKDTIENEIKTTAEITGDLTYGQVMPIVERNAKYLVVPEAVNSIGINYYDSNGVAQTELDPNDHISDGSSFKFDIYLAQPVADFDYWGDMPKIDISPSWDSWYTVYANTAEASALMTTFFETETITTPEGQVIQVASDGWDYQSVVEELPRAFDTLFSEQDQKYIDQDSLSIKDNGLAHDPWDILVAGEHKIEYTYELSNNNCSWFDSGSECHPIDGVTIDGFDGIENTFTFEVYEVVEIDPEAAERANIEISNQVAAEIDTNGDGKVDEGISTNYFKIVTIIEETLEAEGAFDSVTDSFKVEVRAVFNNSIGRPEFFVIDESNIGKIVEPQVTGFQYRIVEASQTRGLTFTDSSGYGYYTTWTGYNYHPPVAAGKIFGNGVMFWLIILAFMALIAAGIGVGTVFIKRRRDEIARYDDTYVEAIVYTESGPVAKKAKKPKKPKGNSSQPKSNNIFLS